MFAKTMQRQYGRRPTNERERIVGASNRVIMDDMTREWSSDQLRYLADVLEMQISAPSSGTAPTTWVPIWVVVSEHNVLVRTWYRRSTGWYGRAVASGRAWIRVSGDAIRVRVSDVGSQNVDAIDTAYRRKYGVAGASSMVTAEAAASTLRLTID